MKGLFSVEPASLKSRGEAELRMKEHISEVGVRQFLLKNLSRNSDGFEWKMNLPVISNKIEEVGVALSNKLSFQKTTLFVHGTASDYVLSEDKNEIKKQFPNAYFIGIKDAGHWIHAEKTEAFLDTIQQFLKLKG